MKNRNERKGPLKLINYQNSDFILNKETILSTEPNKKSKVMGKKNGESGLGIRMSNSSSKVFKSYTFIA